MIYNRRNISIILLVALLLVLATTPALAWWDEGDTAGVAARPCRIISGNGGGVTVTCFDSGPYHNRQLVQQDLPMHPAVARAEEPFQSNRWTTGVLAQAER
jgi:predicted nucleic acid-binding Zn ribbon protein